jgi:glycosyltransferase involved in cell wall biosynthesis
LALVSIIVPTYNAEKHLLTCLSSIAEQDFPDIEVLVVDDGSEDASVRIAREFAKTDPRFRCFTLENNKGVMVARATGVRLCGGEFIGFVDADDLVEPSMFSRMVCQLQADNSDIAICGVSYLLENGAQAKKHFRFKKDCVIENGLAQFAGRNLGSAYLCNKLYRRRVIFDASSFNIGVRLDLGEDILINFCAFARAQSVSILAEVLYKYRQNPNGSTGAASNAEAFANLFLAYCLCLKYLPKSATDLVEYVDMYFSVQFNFRCYQIASASELEPHRERIATGLRLLSDVRPEAVLCLMTALKRRGGADVVVGDFFRKVFR